MASPRSLQYYRGQYSPESMYEGSYEPTIYSMYNPEAEAQFIDAVARRQERYDATKMGIAQEKARIGDTETYDLAELTNRLTEFESGITSLVNDKYNGDYSAAANEIATMIGNERSNPFYHFNRQKVEAGKAFLDAKMKLGHNFMSVGNPFDVSFDSWQEGQTFDFTPVNREDVVKQAAIEFGHLKDVIMGEPALESVLGGQYFRNVMQRGIEDPTALVQYLESPEGQGMINNIVANNPILGQLPQDQLMSAVYEGAHSAIGRTEVDYMPNRAFDADGGGGMNIGDTFTEGPRVQSPVSAEDYLTTPFWKDDLNAISTAQFGKDFDSLENKEKRQLKRALKKSHQSIPSHVLNRYVIFDSKTALQSKATRDNFDDLVKKNGSVPGRFIGASSKDDKLMKNVDANTLEVLSYSVIPSHTQQGFPVVLNLHLRGSQKSDAKNRQPYPEDINVMVNPELSFNSRGQNLSTQFYWYLSMLNNQMHSDMVHTLRNMGNTQGANWISGIPQTEEE